ncbi:hypothetical protein [Brevundimonas sp. R86498]|uniref:hypothetical protein n=1 Tax=Brevundimonas sp. R86498 TaxID=3093845 RepID=UPI0037C900CB
MSGVEQIDPYLLSVLFARETGLPVTVWVRTRGTSSGPANLMVATSPGDRADMYEAAFVALGPEGQVVEGCLDPDLIKAVKRWTGLNAGCLLDHWDGRTDSVEMVRGLITVSSSPAHPRESGDPVVS